ncbi:MAG: hypothetical protein A2017_09580 [Lentisphaerae bacterium GWF2_44_16]|nr:MAG: hypothetical protein A2017_09580 [Lentisphaerae bacterium GWF2_44_16]
MIKVLRKAFGILENVAEKKGEAVFLGNLAKKLNLAQPTCSRIVKELVSMGYLEQTPLSKGFIPGPMAYSLAHGSSYRKDIIDIAGPLIHKCAEEIKESVLIAVLNNGRRYVPYHHNGNPELQIIIDKPYYEDIYTTATGRMLLAYSAETEIKEYIEKNGLPGERWEKINSEDELLKELCKIKQNAFVSDEGKQLIIFAYPIFQRNTMLAALGCSVPKNNFMKKNKEYILQATRQTAERISKILTER